jgi:hypothetical protein
MTNTLKRWKLNYPGLIMRNDTKYKLLKSILRGKVLGERKREAEEGYHGSRT